MKTFITCLRKIRNMYMNKFKKNNSQIVYENEDFEVAMRLTKTLLVPFGLWPLQGHGFYNFFRPILIIFGCFLLLFLAVPQTLFIFLIIKDVNVQAKLLGSLGYSILIAFKYVVMIVKRSKIAECLHMIAEDWFNTDNGYHKDLMMEKLKSGKTLMTIGMLWLCSGYMPYTILPSTKSPIVVGNVTYWRLPYPAYFHYFDPRIKPIYHYVYLIQGIAVFMRYIITCGMYSIVVMSVMHISSRVAILSHMLQKLAEMYNQKLLGRIVQEHINFLILANKLEDTFKELLAAEVLGGMFNTCFIGYLLLTELSEKEDLTMLILVIILWLSIIFNMFILCYAGETLTEQCESVRYAAYKIDWYQSPYRDIRVAVLLISLKRKPTTLTAGKIITLSLGNFTIIMKAAFSYLNLLRTLIANAG